MKPVHLLYGKDGMELRVPDGAEVLAGVGVSPEELATLKSKGIV